MIITNDNSPYIFNMEEFFMCGIVGYIGKEKCLEKIINGLESLEYRGYDSAGIAYKVKNHIRILKKEGRITNLKNDLDLQQDSFIGIGHTRWATHGRPCQLNSHPHQVGAITLVHNGIIENYEELKKELQYEPISETDSEVLAAYINQMYQESQDILSVLSTLEKKIIGSYALGILVEGEDKIYAIRKDSPLIIGRSEDGNFIASDVPAILQFTKKYQLLLNHEYAVLEKDHVIIFQDGKEVEREVLTFVGEKEATMKNGFAHFMLKEIYEQPKVIYDTVQCYIKDDYMNQMAFLDEFDAIDIVGCGSAYHAGLVGASLLKKYGDIPVQVAVASEYRYTKQFYQKNHLLIVISQSGETADTLAVLRNAKEQGIHTLAIVNVVGSSIARETDQVFYIKAGVEVAVATTKAYTCQLALLSLFACYLGIKRGILKEDVLSLYDDLGSQIETILKEDALIKDVAQFIQNKNDIFYLGRQVDYALCMEASLKLKEVSYLHSEAYAAGELKHGTISLIEEGTPVISLLTDEELFLKTLSNVKEVVSRGAFSVIITNQEIMDKTLYQKMIQLPKTLDLTGGILVMVVCQLLAYYVALYKECDIDKPRNLAKSVTVE